MIRRIYVHNYRCFQNFDFNVEGQSSVLILGKNGTGKSTLSSALKILQGIAKGENRVKQFLSVDDFAFNQTDVPVRIELSVELNNKVYDYAVAFELPDGFKEPRVREEKLMCDNAAVYSRDEAQVELTASRTRFLVDWHLAALPIVQIHGQDNPIETFRSWLSRLVLIAPVPSAIHGESEDNSLYPEKNLSNFANWFRGVLGEYPASYSVIDDFLKQMLPDFMDFQNKPIGETAKKIVVRFGIDEKILRLDLDQLSDGEKIFFVCAVLLAANKYYGPTFCLWDEPDNFVSLSEVGHMVVALRKSFAQSGQLFITSHNPEAIRKFTDESTLHLDRRSHLEPTRARWLSDLTYQGDLIESLIRGDISNGS